MKYLPIAALCLALLGGGYVYIARQSDDATPEPVAVMPGAPLVQVALPETLTENAQIGQRIFDANCATCHGPNASGREGMAPPLVHKIYEPSHHGDASFQLAVAQGVRAHHWPYGNMPAVTGLTQGDVTMVITYVRELQRANGIN
jgi:mono/diheme cytochrome c family protein